LPLSLCLGFASDQKPLSSWFSGHVILTGRNTFKATHSIACPRGINGPTSKAAVRNADNNLKQILAFIDKDRDLATNTDIFMSSDHGFGMISKQPLDATGGHVTQSYAGP
jgi:hypothetical protein